LIRDLATSPTLECKSEEEAKKLFKEEKVYRVIKLDLFDEKQVPFIRYYPSRINSD